MKSRRRAWYRSENLYTRLSRTVRDAAKSVEQESRAHARGRRDRTGQQHHPADSDPLIHLVRNAVAHGIERDGERYDLGKSDTGSVAVRAYHRGNHIYIEVEDDGRGPGLRQDPQDRYRNGLGPPADAAAELGERDLLDFISILDSPPRRARLSLPAAELGSTLSAPTWRSSTAKLKLKPKKDMAAGSR